jgi:zinc transport system substrate-binding protein
MNIFRLSSFVSCLSAALLAGCGSPAQSATKPLVLCTIFSYFDAARAIAGDKADVQILIPPDQSPHEYQTSLHDKALAAKAALYIKNGLGLDDSFDGLVDRSKTKVLEIGKEIDTKAVLHTEETSLDGTGKKETPKEEDNAFGNPHIWLDPKIQMAAAEKIRDAMTELDPADAATFKTNAEQYLASLKKLDADFADAAAHFKTREFIGFHSAYDYLAHRYGLTQIASIEEVPGGELTIAQIQKVTHMIQDHHIKYIAIENAFSTQGIDTIKKQTGVETMTLQPLETYDDVKETYVGLMRENLEALKKALD